MATTCEHVAPGDLITSEFVNCLLDKIDALEKRVKALESSQLTPDWKDYFNDLLKDYLKENDSRLMKLLEGLLKADDPRLSKLLEGLLKDDDPRLYKILEGWLKPGDIRIVEQIKEWLKPDDPWFEQLLDGWMKIEDPRLMNILEQYMSDKRYVEEPELGNYARKDEVASAVEGYIAQKHLVEESVLETYATLDEVAQEVERYASEKGYVGQSELQGYVKASDAESKYVSMSQMGQYATTRQVAAFGAALITSGNIALSSESISVAGKSLISEIMTDVKTYTGR